MASFVSLSSPSLFLRTRHYSLPPVSSESIFKGRLLMLPVKCCPEPNKDAELESETRTSSSSSSVATYRWFAALGALGFMETGYLTYLKLTNSDAVCPISGGSCNDILNSDYAFVFGVPLPLIGMVAYGLVAALGLQLADRSIPFADESNGQLILLGITTSMAAASAYFLYIISTKFTGTFCSYCLISALLSFCLFFLTFKDFRLQEMQKMVAVQLCIAGLVVAALSTSYSTAQPIGGIFGYLSFYIFVSLVHGSLFMVEALIIHRGSTHQSVFFGLVFLQKIANNIL